jgi:hypothetical protein
MKKIERFKKAMLYISALIMILGACLGFHAISIIKNSSVHNTGIRELILGFGLIIFFLSMSTFVDNENYSVGSKVKYLLLMMLGLSLFVLFFYLK